MKKVWIILSVLLGLFVLVFAGAYIFVNVKGKDILAQTLKQQFKAEAKVGSLTLTLPFTLEIKGFSCGDVSFGRLRVTPIGYDFSAKRLSLAAVDIDALNVTVTMDQQKLLIKPFVDQPLQAPQAAAVPVSDQSEWFMSAAYAQTSAVSAPAVPISVKVNVINLKGGRVTFIDARGKKPITIYVNDIAAKVNGLVYPELTRFTLDVLASLEARHLTMKKAVTLKGWVDYSRKDMDVSLDAAGLKYSAFLDYFPKKWMPDSLSLEEAFINAPVKMVSKNDDLVIDALVIFDKVDFKPGAESNPLATMLKTVLESLRQKNNGQAQLPNFVFKTKMSAPVIDTKIVTDALNKMLTGDLGMWANLIAEQSKGGAGNIGTIQGLLDTCKSLKGSF